MWEYAADPFPMPDGEDKVTRIPKDFFYWIRCAAPRDGMYITAVREGNEFDVSRR